MSHFSENISTNIRQKQNTGRVQKTETQHIVTLFSFDDIAAPMCDDTIIANFVFFITFSDAMKSEKRCQCRTVPKLD